MKKVGEEIPKDPQQELEELLKRRKGITMWNDITADDRVLLESIDVRAEELNKLIIGKAKETLVIPVDREENEAETKDPEGTWVGDWSKGERPYGYVRSDEDREKLRPQGFSLSKSLQETGWKQDMMDDYYRVLAIAKTGRLSADELKKLLEYNKAVTAEISKFKATQLMRDLKK